MARNVYFDPFGAYTGGIQAGINDGMQLQRGVRDAKAMDYDLNVRQPILTQGLQRNENFEQYFDPMRRTAAGYGLERARMGVGRDAIDYASIPAMLTGNVSPAQTALSQWYGLQGVPDQYGGMDYLDTNAPESATGGMPGSYDPSPTQSILDYYFRPQAMEQAGFNRQLGLDDVTRQNSHTQLMYMLQKYAQPGATVDDDGGFW